VHGNGTVPGFSALDKSAFCDSGSSANLECKRCPINTFSGVNDKVCTPCTAECLSGFELQSSCLTEATFNTASCQFCAVGKFKAGVNDELCTPCAPGTYQDREGSSVCIPCRTSCEPGTELVGECTGGNASDVSCVACSPGTYKAGTNTGACTDCAAGTYQKYPGLSACEPCRQECGPGTELKGTCALGSSADTTRCDPCKIGHWKATKGEESCSLCDLGMIKYAYVWRTLIYF
jgi:hypothetical protein